MKKKSKLFKFDTVLTPVLFIIMPGTCIHALNEYLEGGFSYYFIRDIVVISLMILGYIGYRYSLMSKSNLFSVPIYSIVGAIMATVIIGRFDPGFKFEPVFLQSEMILSLLMLMHYKQVKNLLIFNFFYVLFCFFTVGSEYPIDKFIYHGMIVCGAGVMSYASQSAFVKLAQKLKEANILIKEKNEELKKMNRAKDQLFRIIGHDLRTPFFQLKSLVEMIDEVEDEYERKKIRELLKESADKGNQLLEDLLKWGNSYQHQYEVSLEKQSVSTIVERVFEFSDLSGKRKGVNLINEIPDDLELTINPTMMETVMRNLIANAIKFSHRGSHITVNSQKEEQQVKIAIVDKGVGICDNRIQKLLVNDKNESTVGTDNEQGSGFGLSISKKLVEKQNGTFEIQSECNKGTTIYMSFPIDIAS
ncbi:sensor histidine kinase [Aquimarina sp. 2304DJ70-9]|uniref:sensor histidine kinase n=1 Tax=Aquimarina penaris TaxID=3231044 RepID=UPI0034632FF0